METKQKQMKGIDAKGSPRVIVAVIRKYGDNRIVRNFGNKLMIDSDYLFGDQASLKEKGIVRA